MNDLRPLLNNLFQGQLRDYQIETIQAILNYYFEGNDGNVAAALPTGVGKTRVIAGFIFFCLYKWPGQRFLVLSHVKELLLQNYNTMKNMWANAPVGIYSSALNRKDASYPIVIGGIASIVNNIETLGFFDVLLVDECHLISPNENSMYQKAIKQLKETNPKLIVVGLSATIFRLQQGLLTDGDNAIIDDIVINLTTMHPFNRFIAEGYLAPAIAVKQDIEIDLSGVKILKGDYSQNQLEDATERILYEALSDLVQKGHDRHCWLIFCAGIKASEHAAEILNSFGIAAAAIHSKLKENERDERLNAFKRGELKAIVGNNIFTTGFDHPPVDLIGMLRSTISPGLWIQMVGRGTRPYDCNNPQQYIPGFDYVKTNCIVLDYAGNAKRLGPINDPVIPRKKGEKTGDVPIKVCDECGVYNHASARYCGGKPYPTAEGCGAEFKFKTKLVNIAGTEEIIKGDMPTIETFDVSKVLYHKHEKMGSPPSLKVSYYVGLQRYTEYQCFEHKGYAKTRAANWWRMRHSSEPPATVDEALIYVSQLRMPKSIRVRTDLHYPEILSADW